MVNSFMALNHSDFMDNIILNILKMNIIGEKNVKVNCKIMNKFSHEAGLDYTKKYFELLTKMSITDVNVIRAHLIHHKDMYKTIENLEGYELGYEHIEKFYNHLALESVYHVYLFVHANYRDKRELLAKYCEYIIDNTHYTKDVDILITTAIQLFKWGSMGFEQKKKILIDQIRSDESIDGALLFLNSTKFYYN
jgi:hypothetical protein